jgi:hypothetical protein
MCPCPADEKQQMQTFASFPVLFSNVHGWSLEASFGHVRPFSDLAAR